MPTSASRYDAIVVGAGPNGLTAAARLTRAGWRVLVIEAATTIGGGSRTKALGPVRYDVCAAVHPFGASSPAFEALHLDEHGLAWGHPPLALAHPFDDGGAAALSRTVLPGSVDPAVGAGGVDSAVERAPETDVGVDRRRWHASVTTLGLDWERVRHLVLGPVPVSLLRHPLQMARFGVLAGLPSNWLARGFSGREAPALLTGLAAHSGVSLGQPTTGGVGLALGAATEAVGMPVAIGGSQSIVDALASVVRAGGGEIETDRTVRSIGELPTVRAVLLDLTPGQAAALVGRPARRWRHGVAATKLDLVLSEPMPWTSSACRGAGTVHLGGEWRQVAAAERATAEGALPERPFVIVSQPTLADPGRAPGGEHVVWAYRHVPNGCDAPDAIAGIERQFDRFAPGWRDLVLHRRETTAGDHERYNACYVGGDIAGGAMTPWQTIARPRVAFDPYRYGNDGVWLCSQSTAPGPGVHGMCGWHAAGSVLVHDRRTVRTPR